MELNDLLSGLIDKISLYLGSKFTIEYEGAEEGVINVDKTYLQFSMPYNELPRFVKRKIEGDYDKKKVYIYTTNNVGSITSGIDDIRKQMIILQLNIMLSNLEIGKKYGVWYISRSALDNLFSRIKESRHYITRLLNIGRYKKTHVEDIMKFAFNNVTLNPDRKYTDFRIKEDHIFKDYLSAEVSRMLIDTYLQTYNGNLKNIVFSLDLFKDIEYGRYTSKLREGKQSVFRGKKGKPINLVRVENGELLMSLSGKKEKKDNDEVKRLGLKTLLNVIMYVKKVITEHNLSSYMHFEISQYNNDSRYVAAYKLIEQGLLLFKVQRDEEDAFRTVPLENILVMVDEDGKMIDTMQELSIYMPILKPAVNKYKNAIKYDELFGTDTCDFSLFANMLEDARNNSEITEGSYTRNDLYYVPLFEIKHK